MRTGRAAAIGLATLVAVAFGGCGGDDDGEAARAADLERYCELSAQLDQGAEEHFGRFEEGATQEDFQQAHVEFIEQNRSEIDELGDVAPEEISGDVETVLEGMRAQAGEEVEVSEAEIDAADERVRQFEREGC